MATVPFPGVWSAYSDFGSNSQFVIDPAGTIWLVSTTTSVGVNVYKSSDNGRTFQQVVELIAPSSTSLIPFDPAVEIDTYQNLRIIGQVETTPGSVSLVSYVYKTISNTLVGPTILYSGATSPADYDVLDYGESVAFVTALHTLHGVQSLNFYIVSAANVVTSSGVLQNQSVLSERMTSLSTAIGTLEGSPFVMAFVGTTQNTLTSGTTSIQIGMFYQNVFQAVGQISVPARYMDKDLTVIFDGVETFYLAIGFYVQQGTQLAGSLAAYRFVYNPAQPSTPPVITSLQLTGTPSASYLKPVLSHSTAGLVLAYVTTSMNPGALIDGAINIVNLDPVIWQITPRTDFPYTATAYYLRGTKSVIPAATDWCFMAQRVTDDTARFYSGFNSPPVVVLTPTTLDAKRGITYQLDASQSYDVNLNTLVFTWSLTDPTDLAVFTSSGSSATLLVPTTVGPGAASLTVSVSVTAFGPDGSQLHAPVTATSSITVDAVAAPQIAAPETILAQRNSTLTITPVVTDTGGNALTYFWLQTGGTQVAVLSGSSSETLEIKTNGALVAGEVLYFQLTVSDNINVPVLQTFEVSVPPMVRDISLTALCRSYRTSGAIATRNTNSTWGVPSSEGWVTGFTNARQGALISGIRTTTFVGPNEVLAIVGDGNYHVYLPNRTDVIVDALHDASDVVLVLAQSSNIFVFIPNGLDTDNVFATIALTEISVDTYTSIFATPQFNNERVIALSGPSGCLLLLVECTGYTVTSSLELTLASGLLYGANAVQWVRLSGVESLHTGQVLIGTVDGDGNSYETLVALKTRSVVAVWDATSLQNDVVTTGELLTTTPDTYAGSPLAPVITGLKANPDDTITISWSQTRSDLVSAFQVQMALDGVTFQFLLRVNSGQVLTAVTPPQIPGNTYTFEVQALSLDGASPWSSPSAITL